MKKKVLIGFLIVFGAIQFIRIDKTNPTIVQSNDIIEITKPDKDIAIMLKSACYDCHSSETKYPWYTNIAPVSWIVKGHINDGRKYFSFSEWGTYSEKDKRHYAEECAEEIEYGEMPKSGYVFMHAEADLSDEDKKKLMQYFESL